MSNYTIINACIADGSGTEPFYGNVSVCGDRIAAITADSAALPSTPGRIIDAEGMMLTPGFIDAHGHSDISILAAPEAFGKITQGITTEITGNCGLSVFPLTDMNKEHIAELYRHYNVDFSWNNLQEYAEKIRRVEPAINLRSLCGHNTLRSAVLGYRDVTPDSCGLRRMQELLADALAEGAGGLSTGLLYVPGKFAEHHELKELSRTTAESAGIITSHLRSEGKKLLESVDEFAEFAAGGCCRKIHISHLKAAGRPNWGKTEELLKRFSKGYYGDLSLTADVYPYCESMTQLSVYMPEPYSDMNESELMHHLRNPANFADFLKTLELEFSEERWKTLRLVSTGADFISANFAGQTFYEIAEETSIPPRRICAELLKQDAPGTLGAGRGISEANMKKIITRPYTCCCTDESARPNDYSIGRSHPRGFGAFREFFRLLSGTLPVGNIIRKMTSLPAEIFEIRNRGLLKKGFYADMVLLDPARFADSDAPAADFAAPHRPAEGIISVWVNGIQTYTNANGMTGRRAGRVMCNSPF